MTEDDATPPTWSDLKDQLRWFARVFGDPADLLREGLVDRAQAALIQGWLRGLEALTRALLAVAAAAMPAPGPARRHAEVWRRRGVRPGVDASDADSARWTGISFRCLPRSTRSRTRRASFPPRRFLPTAAFARRFEALIRVAEAPDRFARRLAARLRKNRWLTCRLLGGGPPSGRRSFAREDVEIARTWAWRALEVLAVDTG